MKFDETKFNVGDVVFTVVDAPRVEFDTGADCVRCHGKTEWCGLCNPESRTMIYPVDNFKTLKRKVEGITVSLSKWCGGPHEWYTLASCDDPGTLWIKEPKDNVFSTEDEASICAAARFSSCAGRLLQEHPKSVRVK